MSESQVQQVIDALRERRVSEKELILLLGDARGLVRVNALMTLPEMHFDNPREIVTAVLEAAFDSANNEMLLMGSVTQKMFALATLSWMENEVARQAYASALGRLDDKERERVLALASEGPVRQ